MEIKYYYNEIGETCEHCGHGIKNVYQIIDGNKSLKVGCECIKKITSIKDLEYKKFNKDKKKIEDFGKIINDLNTLTTEELINKYYDENKQGSKDNFINWLPSWKKQINNIISREEKELNEILKGVNIRG